MSTFSQFLPQGDSFSGEMIAGPATVWGGNPIFSGKEYLRTGLLKTYSSEYEGLLQALPTACVANESSSNMDSSWWSVYYAAGYAYGYYVYAPPKLYTLGGNLHLCYPITTGSWFNTTLSAVKYAASFANTANGDVNLVGDGATAMSSGDSIKFNNRILVVLRGQIWASPTGGSYSVSFNSNPAVVGAFAASPSLVICAPSIDATGAPRIVTSPDGANWTQRTSNLVLGAQARMFYSTPASAFFYISNAGEIYTSTDGYNWTARTAPTGMPTSVGGYALAPYVVDTPTATYVSLGAPNTSSTYMLKITALTTYQLIDLATTGSGNLVGLFSGTAGIIPYINYDGTYLYISNNANRAYSTDGINWTLDTLINQTLYPGYNRIYPISNFVDDKVYYTWAYASGTSSSSVVPFEFTNKSFGATPDFVGSATVLTFASGSNLSTYFRIK